MQWPLGNGNDDDDGDDYEYELYNSRYYQYPEMPQFWSLERNFELVPEFRSHALGV